MKEQNLINPKTGDISPGLAFTTGEKKLNGNRDFIQQLGVACYQCNLDGAVTDYNEAAFELWGKAPVETDRWGATLQVKDADGNVVRQNAHPMLAAIQQATAQMPKELELLRLDGTSRYVLAYASPVFNEEGAVSGATNVLADISNYRKKTFEPIMSRKVAVDELRLMQLAIENAVEGIIITDASSDDLPIIYANNSFYKITGYQPEDVIGKNCRFLQGPETDGDVVTTIRQKINERRLFEGEILNYKKDGTLFWNALSIIPIVNENGETSHFVGFQSDITMRKLAEEKVVTAHESLEVQVRKRTIQLEDANKELEAFNYSVSHDLQSPLRTISGFSRILLNEYRDKLGSDATEHLEYIEKSVKQMSALIKSLLSFSKLGKAALNYSNVDLDGLLQQVIEELKISSTNPTVEIIRHDLKYAICDADLMKQVWANLVGNAVKYSSKRANPMIEIGVSNNKEELVYYIRDNGAGFNMDEEHKLFAPFQRLHTEAEFEGTGVGLATVQRIIAKHGGRIWANAKPGEGATFYFTMKGTVRYLNAMNPVRA